MKKKQLREFDKRLTDEEETLNQYLYQYKDCISRKKMLERRKTEIAREFDCPLKSVNYDGMPHSSGVSVGSAAISFRLDEINTKIIEQMQRAEKILSDIMNVIDFLEENSLERAVIENRYIDRMSWEATSRVNYASRSKIMRYWRRGLHQLLDFAKVQKILKEYQESLGA